MKAPFPQLKRILATVLCASLLHQQGFLVLEAAAQVVAVPKTAPAVSAGAGSAGAGLYQSPASGLSLPASAGSAALGGTLQSQSPLLPALDASPVVPGAALTPASVQTPLQAAAGSPSPIHAAAPLDSPKAASESFGRASKAAASSALAPALQERPAQEPGLFGRLSAFGAGLIEKTPAVSLRRFFDGAQPFSSRAEGGGNGVANYSNEGPGAKPRTASMLRTGFSAGYARFRELREILGDGTRTEQGWVQPFKFMKPDGFFWHARSAGLEGFYYTKLEFEREYGDAVLAQLDNFFPYLLALFEGKPWAKKYAMELRTIRYLDADAKKKNELLNSFLSRSLAELREELDGVDKASWGRSASVYMILARAYNRLKPGKNFFDSFDKAEFDRIKGDTHANTLYLLDIFEIGKIHRWGKGGGSPYAIRGYHVKAELGGDAAFTRMVERAHKAGLKVMVDYIPNHTALDSRMMKEHPEAFIHIVPPQPEPGQDLAGYRKRLEAEAPDYYLIETDNYPEDGKRVHKFILVHYPVQGGGYGFRYVDMGQVDYSQPVARAWRAGQLREAFERFGIDGVRRDLAYFVVNGKFFPHWLGTLKNEMWTLDTPWVKAELRRLVGRLERSKAQFGEEEYLEQLVREVGAANPAAWHIDEAYEKFTELSRSGSRGLYNKIGLFEAVESRNIDAIRGSLREIAFRTWQHGAAGLVNYPLSHDADDNRGGRGYAVDRYGKWLKATLAMTLMARPHLIYNGIELGAPQRDILKSAHFDESSDMNKPIPFDIPVSLDWDGGNPANQEFFRRLTAAGARSAELFNKGSMEVLKPYSATSIAAYSVGMVEDGVQKAVIVAGNFGDADSWGHFRIGKTLLPSGFAPERGKKYVLRDQLHMGEDGRPAEYVRTGAELLDEGLYILLAAGDAHVFEIEELDAAAPTSAPSPAQFFSRMGAGLNGILAEGAGPRTADLELEKIKVYLTRHGKDPVAATLKELRDLLAEDPEFVQGLNEAGRIRFIHSRSNPNGGLTAEDAEAVEEIFRSYGVTAKVSIENLPIDWARKAEREAAEKAGSGSEAAASQSWKSSWWWKYLAGPVTLPVREAAFLARTLAQSLTMPTWTELIGGVVSKTPGMVLGIIWWTKLFLPAHPLAFAAAVGLSLALNVFHGIWINSWTNFQNIIGRQRGIQYQTVFNLLYTQLTGAMFRVITWAVIAGTVAPWTLTYWRDIGLATILGSFFGTLGYQGLNGLYDKGRIPRTGRSIIQQVRDLFFMLGGTFFGAGSMTIFWTLFSVQQSVEIVIYTLSRRAKKRPIIYIADEDIASSDEFQAMYPVKPGPEPSPLRLALNAIIENPLIKPVSWAVKKLWQLLRGKPKTGN